MNAGRPERMYTVAEAAEILRYSEWMIRKFCRQGLIKSGRRRSVTSRSAKGLKILIPESEITRFSQILIPGGK